ncbi:MAG: ATP F0F1 synthase subunit B [Alphaproteobacteria bacterium]|nr:ATP F0F1 synthase subunit B [Alphaproteobacteria bacterium]MDE2110725.1 ATP F0F1 synthase subunit B [Alphaproteobacteria bacterium]MDE2494530.1 ATP F0F1 synthase subunit B [Alphaproteobacteria bacterium]
MSTFRTAASSLTVGSIIFLLVIHRAEVPGITMTLFQNPEFWVAVGLAVVITIFLRLRVPGMLAKMLDERAAAIANELDEAKRLREEAAAILAGYVQKASQAESEAAAIIAEAKAEADRFGKDMRAQLRAQIDRRAQMAKDKIEQAEAAALAEIKGLAADTATAAAEKLIAARVDEKRAAALIGDSIKELSDKLN